MSDYEFELPFPPSINGYWRNYGNRQIISKRGRIYRKNAIQAMALQNLNNRNISNRLEVTIILRPPTKAKRDIDNYAKASLDAITHSGFWVDDEQIDRLLVVRGEKVKGGLLIVKVKII